MLVDRREEADFAKGQKAREPLEQQDHRRLAEEKQGQGSTSWTANVESEIPLENL